MWKIRKAREDDASRIFSLEKISHPNPWSPESIVHEIRQVSPHSHFWVAVGRERRAAVLGYIVFQLLFEEMYVVNLAVAPENRRNSVAKLMLKLAMKWCRRQGGRRAVLEVRADNEPAIKLYQALGFRTVHVRVRGYHDGTPAHVMATLLK